MLCFWRRQVDITNGKSWFSLHQSLPRAQTGSWADPVQRATSGLANGARAARQDSAHRQRPRASTQGMAIAAKRAMVPRWCWTADIDDSAGLTVGGAAAA